jgi:hypothetical protein
VGMANVLNEEKKQQVLALGRLGWPVRRIQQAARIRRETASAYLKAAGRAFDRRVGAAGAKTGQRSDHRLGCGTTGHAGDGRSSQPQPHPQPRKPDPVSNV